MSFLTPPPPGTSRDASTRYITAHVSLKMAQTASLVIPPTYLVLALIRRRPISIGRWMRASTLGVAGGAALGVPMSYMRLKDQTQEALDDRVFRLSHNPSQIRTDDYSVMGAALGALLVPALFLKRTRLPGLVIGGASIGLGAGVWVHLAKMFTEGSDVRPEGMVGELPGIGGNDK